MRMMKHFEYVYRVEHKETHKGPYRKDHPKSAMRLHDAHSYTKTHPIPSDDKGIKRLYEGFLCCFKTKKQMRRWFKGHIPFLRKQGFVLTVYKVRKRFWWDVQHGQKQSIFNPSAGTRRVGVHKLR